MTDPGPARRDPALLVALATSGALAATLFLLPSAPWRIPLALLGGIWAPGYALLGAAYPRGELTQLERHALATTAGLCLLPLLVLLGSESVGLTPVLVAAVALAATIAFAALATWRARRRQDAWSGPEPVARTMLPSTKWTIAICVAALALAAVVEAGSVLTSRPEPPSLAMTFADGPVRLDLTTGEEATAVFVVTAGARAREGDIVVTWDGEEVHRESVALAQNGVRSVEVPLPTGSRGDHELRATWLWLSVEAGISVEAA